jgi:hypothetical protein
MLILLPRVFKASSKWLSVPVWLLCAFLLAAFLDQSPDPPAIKPGLIAAASVNCGPASFSHPDWSGPQHVCAPLLAVRRMNAPKFVGVHNCPFQRALATTASDSSPPLWG